MKTNALKNSVIFWIAFLIAQQLYGQATLSNVTFDYTGGELVGKIDKFVVDKKNFTLFLGNYVAQKYLKRKSICSQGIFHIKFQVSQNGQITSLSSTNRSDTLVANIFKKAIKQTEKYWKTDKLGNNNILLLPIEYSYNGGCKKQKESIYHYADLIFDDGTKMDNLFCFVLQPLIQGINNGQENLTNFP